MKSSILMVAARPKRRRTVKRYRSDGYDPVETRNALRLMNAATTISEGFRP